MSKLDLKRELKLLYRPSGVQPVIVDVPAMGFLMLDGTGDPNVSPEFAEAIAALYGVAYTLKFQLKKAGSPVDHVVMPLEGLWWPGETTAATLAARDAWQWTLMIAQPDHVTDSLVAEARDELSRKKPVPALPKLRFERFHEGLSAQVMHIGPYSEEEPTIARLQEFIRESGHQPRGRHHEIYLGDPRRTAPEKLKTVIRQPIG